MDTCIQHYENRFNQTNPFNSLSRACAMCVDVNPFHIHQTETSWTKNSHQSLSKRVRLAELPYNKIGLMKIGPTIHSCHMHIQPVFIHHISVSNIKSDFIRRTPITFLQTVFLYGISIVAVSTFSRMPFASSTRNLFKLTCFAYFIRNCLSVIFPAHSPNGSYADKNQSE